MRLHFSTFFLLPSVSYFISGTLLDTVPIKPLFVCGAFLCYFQLKFVDMPPKHPYILRDNLENSNVDGGLVSSFLQRLAKSGHLPPLRIDKIWVLPYIFFNPSICVLLSYLSSFSLFNNYYLVKSGCTLQVW